jgi:hypothetical protein
MHDHIQKHKCRVVNNQYDANPSRTVSIHTSRPQAHIQSRFSIFLPFFLLHNFVLMDPVNPVLVPHMHTHIHKYKNSSCNKTRARPNATD